jgi:hypothetical protein
MTTKQVSASSAARTIVILYVMVDTESSRKTLVTLPLYPPSSPHTPLPLPSSPSLPSLYLSPGIQYFLRKFLCKNTTANRQIYHHVSSVHHIISHHIILEGNISHLARCITSFSAYSPCMAPCACLECGVRCSLCSSV